MSPRGLSAHLGAVAGGLLGLTAFQASVGLELVRPSRFGWLIGGDWTNHFLGWHLFRHEPWHWPPGVTSSLIYPMGTSVGLTDSIPLLAIPFKALNLLAGQDFQYIGFWLLCSFVLQGVFGALLVRTRTPSVAIQVLASSLFVLAPVLLARLGHTALTAHWLILAALWTYFDCEQGQFHRRAFIRLTLLMLVAAATHPYLAVMVYALAGAYHARVLLLTPRHWLAGVVAPLAVLALLSVAVFWLCGYFIVSETTLKGSGFGAYSMNALAPIMPMGRSRLLGPDFLNVSFGEGQSEGYAYFGVGIMVLGAIALAAVFDRKPSSGDRRLATLPLVVVCASLTILALSPTVTVGGRAVLEYDGAFWGTLQQFRASGRMFWPAYYSLIFGIIVLIVRRFAHWQAVLLLVTAVLVQAIDASGAFADARGHRLSQWRNPLRTETFWSNAVRQYRHLSLNPTHLCAPPTTALDFPAFGIVAGRARTTLNAGSTSRIDFERVRRYCRQLAAEWEAGTVDGDTLYVMSIRLTAEFERRAQAPVACIDIDEFGVCFVRDTYLKWQDDYDVTLQTLPAIDELLSFRDRLDAHYRTSLGRGPAPLYGSSAERVRSIARFVSYRLTGCDEQEATDKILTELAGRRELRLCTRHRSVRLATLDDPNRPHDWPARQEVVRMLQAVHDAYRIDAGAARSPTHVDLEGEAVWVLEYLRHRLAGRDATVSWKSVVEDIRSIHK